MSKHQNTLALIFAVRFPLQRLTQRRRVDVRMPARHKQVGHFGVALGGKKVIECHEASPTRLFGMGQVCVERFNADLAIIARDGGETLLPNGAVDLELGIALQCAGRGAVDDLIPRPGADRAATISCPYPTLSTAVLAAGERRRSATTGQGPGVVAWQRAADDQKRKGDTTTAMMGSGMQRLPGCVLDW